MLEKECLQYDKREKDSRKERKNFHFIVSGQNVEQKKRNFYFVIMTSTREKFNANERRRAKEQVYLHLFRTGKHVMNT